MISFYAAGTRLKPNYEFAKQCESTEQKARNSWGTSVDHHGIVFQVRENKRNSFSDAFYQFCRVRLALRPGVQLPERTVGCTAQPSASRIFFFDCHLFDTIPKTVSKPKIKRR
jgi:hypothetical protein